MPSVGLTPLSPRSTTVAPEVDGVAVGEGEDEPVDVEESASPRSKSEAVGDDPPGQK